MAKRTLVRKDQEGVSPVIATILMVAITVVLAAVLYVMVSGLIGGGQQQAPTVTLTSEAVSGTEWNVEVTGITPTSALANFQVLLQNTTSGTATAISKVNVVEGTLGTSGGVTLSFDDLTDDGKLTQGDFFKISGVADSTSYNLILLWKATGNKVAERSVPT